MQTPLATFFPSKKSAQSLFSLQESPVLPREVVLSQHARAHTHAHTHISLSASAPFLFSTRTHISLSLCICSVCVQHVHTHLSLSLYICSVCVQHVHTHLSASAQFLFSTRAHTHISLSLSASAQFLFSARQRRAELNSVKHRYYVACFSNFTCKYSQKHSYCHYLMCIVFNQTTAQL